LCQSHVILLSRMSHKNRNGHCQMQI
jgi:hypothetical protein